MVKQVRQAKRNEVRIIGGKYRGRKVTFPESASLRPTPNRVRETLFNWLAPYIQGARCLDLFAGSGALSFEAISRGAHYCLALDASLETITCLKQNCNQLKVTQIDIIQATFPYPQQVINGKFNIIFVDPPFYSNYVQQTFDWLLACQCLASNALIYVETATDEEQTELPEHWEVLKQKQAGNVRYSLITLPPF